MTSKDTVSSSGLERHSVAPPLLPIKERRGASVVDFLRIVAFALAMSLTVLGTFTIQTCVAIPLRLVPIRASHRLSRRVMGFAREAFGSAMAALSAPHSLGPTSFILTVDGTMKLEALVERDSLGSATGLRLRKNSILISNHQSYGDWLYLWILLNLGHVASGLCIVLMPLLRWVPLAGPGYRLFDFAFVGKGFPIQKTPIVKAARKALKDDTPFSLLLFPEGTLFAADTKPKSDAFAKKENVPSPRNLLLPRSTGLLYCLRSLLSLTPDLALYDCTVGYPGVPARGFAEDYFSLVSTFGRSQPPTAVHIHLRLIDLASVPSLRPPSSLLKTPNEIDAALTAEQRATFQEWTRQRWVEKDLLMDHFYEHGRFPTGDQGAVQLPIVVRREDAVRLAALLLACCGAYLAVRALFP